MRGWGQRNGRAAGCQERQRQKEMKVQRQTPRLREGDTDRQTDACARVHTHTHTHTHTHREAETDGDTERVTERQQTGDRQGREDGIGSETDTLAQPVTHLRGRPRGRSSFPKGGGVSALVRQDGLSALGLAVTRGVPKTSSQPRSQMSPLAWLPKARRNPRPQARGCVRVCV